VTPAGGSTPDPRVRELAANLERVRERIAAACAVVDRSADGVALIAITKTFPASDVVLLRALGITDVGENRDQEAAAKVAEVAAMATDLQESAGAGLRWHFVGALQTNKCASVIRYAHLIHSVDRLRLVDALGRAIERTPVRGGVVRCLVQIDLDDASRPGRAGALPTEVGAIADAIARAEHLELAGVMAVAPLGVEPAAAFRKLADIADAVRQRYPLAGAISAGMSNDLEQAVANGATHLRVGSALLGTRRHPVG